MSAHLTKLTKAAKEADDLDRQLRGVVIRIRRYARDAHEAGLQKKDIARAAGISRPTLDKWLEEK